MKRYIVLSLMLLLAVGVQAQKYRFEFSVADCEDSLLYVGQCYRDEVRLLDTARREGRTHTYVAKGNRTWQRGMYTMVRADGKSVVTDFEVDDSRNFSLSGDLRMTPASVQVKGSAANSRMYAYRARIEQGRATQDSLRKLNDNEALARLDEEMRTYEDKALAAGRNDLYFQLQELCENPTVPDTVQEKARWFREHYWDALFDEASGKLKVDGTSSRPARSEARVSRDVLLHSPQLFKKMNLFFFGILYHADVETISAEVDRLAARIGDDTAMLRYVLQFIEPRYYRSTRNIGWDGVWCHLAERYYLAGKCPWAKESELYVMEKNYKRIKKSLIGAHGQELWMIDTTQIDSPEHWMSSHRQKERYVILWFWDPDCHHCQEQSAELKVLYDSLCDAGAKRFEVYAVGYDSDVDKWKRYVKEHQFRWVNVGGPNVNIDYQDAYNVHGAPTMIILNERRDIIMNKVLPIKSLMAFLDNYEKRAGK